MSIKKRDRDFRLPQITHVDYKHIEMDRVLTQLFPRLKYGPIDTGRILRPRELELKDFLAEFKKHDRKIVEAARRLRDEPELQADNLANRLTTNPFPGLSEADLELVQELYAEYSQRDHSILDEWWFEGLLDDSHAEVVLQKWLETDLIDMVNRGKPNQAIAAPRPLHGNTYKFRNPKHSRDYNAADQVFWMLYHARGRRSQDALDGLKEFFFTGIDLLTDQTNPHVVVDVETQALFSLDRQIKLRSDPKRENLPRIPPLCLVQADILAEDVLRLLAYKNYIPRSVLVEYLKMLLALHLTLYHLRLLKLLPMLVQRTVANPPCGLSNCPAVAMGAESPFSQCAFRIGLVVDMGDPTNTHMTELARRSADQHYRRIPTYMQAHITVRKLFEMAETLVKVSRLAPPPAGFFSLGQILELLRPNYSADREAYFKHRMFELVEAISKDELDPQIKRITELDLTDFEKYIEILAVTRSRYHRKYITDCLDAFLLKNTDDGLLRQARAHRSPRYFSLGSRLLELLLHLAVLRWDGNTWVSTPVRIDELLTFLRERYSLYIDRLPSEEGFGGPSILEQHALRRNVEAFKTRLREIGFFQDLSDAYLTQIVTSRYAVTAEPIAD